MQLLYAVHFWILNVLVSWNGNAAYIKQKFHLKKLVTIFPEQVDDTVGNLAGGRYYCRDSVAAITLGMGTNAAYIESAKELAHISGSSPKSSEMVS